MRHADQDEREFASPLSLHRSFQRNGQQGLASEGVKGRRRQQLMPGDRIEWVKGRRRLREAKVRRARATERERKILTSERISRSRDAGGESSGDTQCSQGDAGWRTWEGMLLLLAFVCSAEFGVQRTVRGEEDE